MAATQTEVKTKLGQNGLETEYRHEAFDAPFLDIPAGAREIAIAKSDGKYVTTYTLGGGSPETTPDSGDPDETTPEPGDPITTFSINGSVGQEPLATHWRYSATGPLPITDAEWDRFKKWEKNPLDETLPVGWPDSEEDAASAGMLDFLKKYNKGRDSYLAPGATIRIQTENDFEPDLGGLGFIAVPEIQPAKPAGCTWLYIGLDATKAFGGKWKTSRDYRLSGPEGWDTDLYTRP